MVNVLIQDIFFPSVLRWKACSQSTACTWRRRCQHTGNYWLWSSLDVDTIHLRVLEELANMRATHHCHLGDKGAWCLGIGYCCTSRQGRKLYAGSCRPVTWAAEKTTEHSLLKYIDKCFSEPFSSFLIYCCRRMDTTNAPLFDWLKTGCPDKLKVVHSGSGSNWWLIKSKNIPEAKRNCATLKRVADIPCGRQDFSPKPEPHSSRCCTCDTRSRCGHSLLKEDY